MSSDVLAPEQIRAARGFLNWSRADAAAAAHISVSTLARLEQGAAQPHAATVQMLRLAFEREGILFTFDPPGVQKREDLP